MRAVPKIFETVIDTNDAWDKIITYRIDLIEKNQYTLIPTADGLFSKQNAVQVSTDQSHRLLIYPFHFLMLERHEECFLWMRSVGDLVSALLNKNKSLTYDDLHQLILENNKYKLERNDIDWILRCLTAANRIVATSNKKDTVLFTPSTLLLARERERSFSATIANELTSLSERVRTIIHHGPTVGTYREDILRNSLKKHLPERYHIATGFIIGLNKQIDILIYDRIDYAPLFREGDLVIVPPESVRAVIEVKTDLTSKNLESALELLDSVSRLDDNKPPFFKGIFAFESSLEKETLEKKIADFYADLNRQAQGGTGVLICKPFQHLTCACVIKKLFVYTSYDYNKRQRLVPVLWSKSSVTELESQSSFFIQSLLSHIKYGGMKSTKTNYWGRMLGEDTFASKIRDLREMDDSWGAYFSLDEGDAEEDAVIEMEANILSVQRWLDAETNF